MTVISFAQAMSSRGSGEGCGGRINNCFLSLWDYILIKSMTVNIWTDFLFTTHIALIPILEIYLHVFCHE